MKKGKKNIIILSSIVIICIIATIIVSMFNSEIKEFVTGNDNQEVLGYAGQKYVNLVVMSDTGTERIYFRGGWNRNTIDFSNAGWCLKKGAGLYGLETSNASAGESIITGHENAYSKNNAKSGYSGSLKWLMDNMIRYGSGVPAEEINWYKANLEKELGISLSGYSQEKIFAMQQYAIWSFTNNNNNNFSSSDPFFTKLKAKAEQNKNYSGDGNIKEGNNKVKIEKASGYTVTKDGWVGPLKISGNNNKSSISTSVDGYTYTICKSKNVNDKINNFATTYNGNFYIKLNTTLKDNTKYNIKFKVKNSAYKTTATYYSTHQTKNPQYGDQPFLMLERTKSSPEIPFTIEYENKVSGNYHINLSKRSSSETITTQGQLRNYTNCLQAGFNLKLYRNNASTTTKNINVTTREKEITRINWDNPTNTKSNSNIKIDNTKDNDRIVIEEKTPPTGFNLPSFTKFEITVHKVLSGNTYKIEKVDLALILEEGNKYTLCSGLKPGECDLNALGIGNCAIDLSENAITFTALDEEITGRYQMSYVKKSTKSTTGIDDKSDALAGATFNVVSKFNGSTTGYSHEIETLEGKERITTQNILDISKDDVYEITEMYAPSGYTKGDILENCYIKLIVKKGMENGKYVVEKVSVQIIHKETGGTIASTELEKGKESKFEITDLEEVIKIKFTSDKITVQLKDPPQEPYKFKIQKTSTESNQDFLQNTEMRIYETIKEGNTTIVDNKEIHNGVFKNEQAIFEHIEDNVNTDYTYYYDIYEDTAQSPYKNILGNKMFLHVTVNMNDAGVLVAKAEVKGVNGYNPTQQEKDEVMKYVETPFVNDDTRTISLKIKNPKETIPVNLQLFKHQLDDKNKAVKDAVFSVKEIDENGNKINDLPGFTTDLNKKTIVNIAEGEIGKSYYYELIEETVPENYVNKISGVRIKAEINAEGKVSSSITQIKQKDSEVWESYSSSFERHTSISQPDENNNIILYMANSVKYDFNLYKKNYASNTNLEQAEKFNGTATFKIEQIATETKEIFNGTLNDARAFFSETEAKASAAYTYRITETSVSDNFYDTLVNVPIILKIRTDADGKIRDESYAGSNWSFENTSGMTNGQIDVLKSLVDLKIDNNNQVNLYIANMPKNYYSLQLVKVDKNGKTITSRNAEFSYGMQTNNADGEGIPTNREETKNGILNISSGCVVDPGYTHTYEIKETKEPLGYTKLPGTISLGVKFTDDGKVLNDNISLRYTNGDTEETIQGLEVKFDDNSKIPTIQVFIPNDSIPLEFELIKEDLKGNRVTAEEDSNGNLQGAHFNIDRMHIREVSDKNTNATDLSFFDGRIINDVLKDGTVNDTVPAFNNLCYTYQIQEVSTKSEYVNIFDRYLINLDVITDDTAKIISADYTVIDIMNHGTSVTESFKQKYGEFVQVRVNDAKDKVTVVIKNTYGYKVRLNKTDTNGKPVQANIEAYLNAYNKEQNTYEFTGDKRKCAINGTYTIPGTSQTQTVTGETTHLSEDYIIPGETQTWTIVERGVKSPYYNIFENKYIDVEVEMNDQYELVVKGYTIKDSNTLQNVSEEELQNLSKYIGNIEFVKEGNIRVLNITIKDPIKYRLKLTKYEADGKTELQGAVLTVNGEEVINNGKSSYVVDNITDIGETFRFTITEKSTAKNHINMLEEGNSYLSVEAKIDENGEIRITNFGVNVYVGGNPAHAWMMAPYFADVYNYVTKETKVDSDGVPTINIGILNPLQYKFELKKVDTSKDKKPLANTKFEIYSPVIKEQNGKYIGSSLNREGVTTIRNSGIIYGTTTEDGKISFGEQNIEVGKAYEYKIKETETSSNVYENIFKDYSVYVKVKLDATGTVTLEKYDNGKNCEIRKDDGTKAPDSYYEYVTVNVDNTGDMPYIKVEIKNPSKIKLKINKKIFGEEEVNLANTKFEIVSQVSGTKELTTDSQGNILLDESPVKEGIYEYIIKEKESGSKDIINILSDNYIKFRLYVSADGSIYTVDAQGNKADNTYELYKADNTKLDFNNTIIDNYVSINTTGKIDEVSVVEVKVLDPQKYDILLLKKDKDTNEFMNNVTFDITVFEQGETEKEVKLKDANTMEDKNLSGLRTSNIGGQDGVIIINNILFEKSGTYKLKLHEKPIEGYIDVEDIEVYVKIEVSNGKYEIIDISYDNDFVNKENTKVVSEEGRNSQIIQIVVENEQVKGSYDLTINKTDLKGIYLDGAEVKVTVLRNGKESELYEANDDVKSKNVIIPVQGKIQNGNLTISNVRIEKPETYTIKVEEITAPEGYVKLEDKIEITITTKLEGQGLDARYVLASANLVDKNELVELKTSEDKLDVTIKNEQFDLALRKFITQIVTNEGQENERVQNITNREPKPITDELKNNVDTTAIYNHTKKPISLYAKDTVIYTIRVYNEADIAGYAEEVTDHLPEYLEFVNDEFNSKYGWILDESDKSLRTVKTNYLSKARDEKGNLIKAFNKETGELDYKEIQIKCKVKDNTPANLKLTNIAEISKYIGEGGRVVTDRDSSAGNVRLPADSELPSYNDENIENGIEYIPGQQDDDDFEKVLIEEFDLALRKFITGVTNGHGEKQEVTTRIPVFKVDENGNYVYEHTKEPVLVANQNVVEYTIRVYNEGTVNGYAKEIKDDIPEGLEFLPNDELNKEYRWIMLDEEGNETDEVNKAKYITTDYLSKENEETDGENLLKAFDRSSYEAGSIKEPDYKEVKVAFKVTMPNTSDEIIINQAQISDDSDEDGNDVTDKDSTPNEWIDGEDDQDIEKIKVQYFDLALRKWVTKAIVIEDGKETVTNTGHKAEDDPEAVVKVDLKKSKINKVVVKFEYQIRVTNEGQIAGSVEEISDYIPEGLKFVATDNPEWEEVDGKVVTDQLAGQIIEPGESKEVTIVLTWINREDNMGLKINVAEISKDYNEYGTPDIDSTPNNKVPGEDDIDDAPVMLTVKTGEVVVYIGITIAVLGILAGGIIGIKKYVIK